jgi:hypothetical protein
LRSNEGTTNYIIRNGLLSDRFGVYHFFNRVRREMIVVLWPCTEN